MLTYDMYSDLDVVIDCKIELNSELSLDKIILTVNGREIEVDYETAYKIYEAVETRIDNKTDEFINDMTSDKLVENYERKLEIKREESRI